MPEKVIIIQNINLETAFTAIDPESDQPDVPQEIVHIHDLTPHGMLLASLGSCTAIVLNTYASHHHLALQQVEITLEYRRSQRDNCENCEEEEAYSEVIAEQIKLSGSLAEKEQAKLEKVAHACSIRKMIVSGMPVITEMATQAPEGGKKTGDR